MDGFYEECLNKRWSLEEMAALAEWAEDVVCKREKKRANLTLVVNNGKSLTA